MKKNSLKTCLILFAMLSFSFVFLTLIFHYDNKYYQHQAPVKNGILDLKDISLEENKLYALVDNWMYYNHQYVNAANVSQQAKNTYVYLGQYPDFSMRNTTLSPYGVSTYRLQLKATKQTKTLSLYFPELDTAAEVWLNDQLLFKNGDVTTTPITSFIKNQVVSFPLQQDSDLFVIVGNDTHYYSGMQFPPVLSTSQGILQLVVCKLVFYGVLCFSSITIALYSLVVWLRYRYDTIMRCFGIATLSFAFFLSKEFLKMVGIHHISLFYALQDMAYFLMLSQVLRINTYLCNFQNRKLYRYLVNPFCYIICILAFFSASFLPNGKAALLALYGTLIDTFKYLSLLYVLYTSYLCLYHQRPQALSLICANTFYIIGILYTLVFANLFEPLAFGWPNEYFSFFVVLAFAVLMGRRTILMLKENEALTEHLGELVDERTRQLELLLKERKAMLSEFAHDLKAPVSSMQSFIELIRLEDIQVDHEVEQYLTIIERKSDELQKRMQTFQAFSKLDVIEMVKKKFSLADFLQKFYVDNRPDCEAKGIYFTYDPGSENPVFYGDKAQLTRALENLLYNAISFTPLNGKIHLSLETSKEHLKITLQDSGCGIPLEDQKHIFEKGVSLREDGQDRGFGLYIAKSIITSHRGRITVQSDGIHGTTFQITFPL